MTAIRVASYLPREPAPLAFLAEAPGASEVAQARRAQLGLNARPGPLRGPSGARHEQVLRALGIDRERCAHLNVVQTALPTYRGTNNSLDGFLVPARDLAQCWREASLSTGPLAQLARDIAAKPVRAGRYFPPAHVHELVRLFGELIELSAQGVRIIVLYGELALWALTGRTFVGAARGAVVDTPFPGLRAIPTYHPANTFHQETNLHHVITDVRLAWELANGLRDALPPARIHVPPTITALRELLARYIEPREPIAADLETSPVGTPRESFYVRSVQFCGDNINAIVVPFEDNRVPNGLYWRTAMDHVLAWELCANVLRTKPTVWHNGVNFDSRVLVELHGVQLNILDDTMVECQVRWPGAGATLHDAAVRLCPGVEVWKKDRG